MSYLWFTADMHLGHANIAKYCGRPWARGCLGPDNKWLSEEAKDRCARNMNDALVSNWNSRVRACDTVIHVGDFCCRGSEQGVSPSNITRFDEWRARLNGTIVFVQGNHDRNNGVKFGIDSLIMTAGGRQLFVVHTPPHRSEEIPDFCNAVLCGHVHEKWHINWVAKDLRPIINVGVDVNNYFPVRLDELMGTISRTEAKRK